MSINDWRKHICRQTPCFYQVYVYIRLVIISKKLTLPPTLAVWDMTILLFKAILAIIRLVYLRYPLYQGHQRRQKN